MFIMKKLISVLCVLTLVIGVVAVSAVSSHAEVSKGSTAVDVKSGDEVSYTLALDKVEQPIIGSDFSVYYDSSVFELVSVADFNNKTNEDDWEATINPDLDGQVRGVWSILKGVDFSSKRNFLTVNLKAKTDATDSHITYRIRYLYDNDVFNSTDYPQITTYQFTCNVTVNGQEVLKDAAPELNVDEAPENGKFVPSLDGDSQNADPEIPGVVDKTKGNTGNGQAVGNDSDNNPNNNANNNGNAGGNGGSANGGANNGGAGNVSGGSGSANNGGAANGGANNADAKTTAAPVATTAEGYFVTATDARGNVTATSDQAPVNQSADKKGVSPVVWIIIVLVVLAGGGAAAYFYMKKKPGNNAPGAPGEATDASAVSADKAKAPEEKQEAPEEKQEAPEEKQEAPEEKQEAPEEKQEAPSEPENKE